MKHEWKSTYGHECRYIITLTKSNIVITSQVNKRLRTEDIFAFAFIKLYVGGMQNRPLSFWRSHHYNLKIKQCKKGGRGKINPEYRELCTFHLKNQKRLFTTAVWKQSTVILKHFCPQKLQKLCRIQLWMWQFLICSTQQENPYHNFLTITPPRRYNVITFYYNRRPQK